MSVHSVLHEKVFRLTESDYAAKHRYELKAELGSDSNKDVQYEFFDFCPRVF